jgi:hypothetical protein
MTELLAAPGAPYLVFACGDFDFFPRFWLCGVRCGASRIQNPLFSERRTGDSNVGNFVKDQPLSDKWDFADFPGAPLTGRASCPSDIDLR